MKVHHFMAYCSPALLPADEKSASIQSGLDTVACTRKPLKTATAQN
ncbi:hypothetical protein QWY86_08365 [Pedobacter aquatilis]|nr:hypothetical protein [Pedobacter aquatilis]MDN3586675.1 hypothetical protein [Pedobacter aquatilis]